MHACAVVLFALAVPAMACCALAYRAHDWDLVYPETMARLLLMHVLADWVGVLWLACDCVSAPLRMFTVLPRKETILSSVFRSLSHVLQRVTLRELWLPAEHNTKWTDTLSGLQARAHSIAWSGASVDPGAGVPLSGQLIGRLVLFYRGALVLAPHRYLDVVYQAVVSASRTGEEAGPVWDGTLFWAHVESTALATWAVRRAFALRLLAHQLPPVDVVLDCHYCSTVLPAMQKHVFEVCPVYHLICLHTFARLLCSSGLPLSSTLLEGHTFVPDGGAYARRDVGTPILCNHYNI